MCYCEKLTIEKHQHLTILELYIEYYLSFNFTVLVQRRCYYVAKSASQFEKVFPVLSFVFLSYGTVHYLLFAFQLVRDS